MYILVLIVSGILAWYLKRFTFQFCLVDHAFGSSSQPESWSASSVYPWVLSDGWKANYKEIWTGLSHVVISYQFSWPTSNSPEEGPCWQWILMRASIEVLMDLNKVKTTRGPDYLYNSQQPNGPLRTINERASLQIPDLRHCWSIEFWMYYRRKFCLYVLMLMKFWLVWYGWDHGLWICCSL